MMRRREFITLLGSAAAWPVAARAQQSDQVKRLGILFGGQENSGFRVTDKQLLEGLAQLGWVEGRNLRVDLRTAGVMIRLLSARMRKGWFDRLRISSMRRPPLPCRFCNG